MQTAATSSLDASRRLSIAPMMDWTDRHCRYLHRLLTRRALLFTEMITSPAVVHGDRERLLGYDPVEHPVAIQLGGSDPAELAEAARIAADWGYDEINLNVGCPSDRVKSGRFGACLMAEPDLVAECVAAMKAAVGVPVTVKCRIGIDHSDPEADLDRFADAVVAAGADALYVHARKAWLQGLSPKENRDIPPLDYDRVYRLASRLAPLPVIINGGIPSLEAAIGHLERFEEKWQRFSGSKARPFNDFEPLRNSEKSETALDRTSGVMIGRAAYHDPMLLARVDAEIFGDPRPIPDLASVMTDMRDYAGRQLTRGVRINQITRHMLGLANGMPGARRFRQILSVEACATGAGPEVIERALAAVSPEAATPEPATA